MKNTKSDIEHELGEILTTLETWLEVPLLVLSFVWLALLIIESVWGERRLLNIFSNAIWIVFILDFSVKFILAPRKLTYLKDNWLTAIALVVPALRVFRIFHVARVFRAARFARGVRLVRVLTSLNRGLKAIGASFGRRGFPYVLGATVLVVFGGAAGMYAFEHDVAGSAIDSYGSAVWWTAMMITSIGSDYFPVTVEGRVLCFIIGLYGFVVFGYITATLASFFVESDAKAKHSSTVGTENLRTIEQELTLLRDDIKILTERVTQQT